MWVRPDIRWRLEEVWVAKESPRRLEGLNVESLESPIAKGAAAGTFSGWRRLRETIRLPIGDHLRGPEDLIQGFRTGALDYAIVGGATAGIALGHSRLASDLGIGGWSHTMAYGPGAAMGLHVATCMPHLSQSYDMVEPMAWESDLTVERFEFAGGGRAGV